VNINKEFLRDVIINDGGAYMYANGTYCVFGAVITALGWKPQGLIVKPVNRGTAERPNITMDMHSPIKGEEWSLRRKWIYSVNSSFFHSLSSLEVGLYKNRQQVEFNGDAISPITPQQAKACLLDLVNMYFPDPVDVDDIDLSDPTVPKDTDDLDNTENKVNERVLCGSGRN